MFKPEPSLTWVQAPREQVVAIVESINQPQVSIPGKASQQVFGHLVGIRNGNGTFSIEAGEGSPSKGPELTMTPSCGIASAMSSGSTGG